MQNYTPVIIIGAGQAGLSTSYYLKEKRIEHLIIEQDEVASTWANKRWDSFTLVTPNWMNQLPGATPISPDPNVFLSKQDVCRYLKNYAATINAPIKTKTRVISVQKKEEMFEVITSQGIFLTSQVVVAVSAFSQPRLPECSRKISGAIHQIHSEQYKNPLGLPPGAVLIVGSAQSGCQIAEELLDAGRRVFLATSKVGRLDRRYKGKDICEWMTLLGVYEKLSVPLSETAGKLPATPHVSGTKGGHTINLWDLGRKGVTLLGGVQDAHSNVILLKENLLENLNFADGFFKTVQENIDKYSLENPTIASVPELESYIEHPEIDTSIKQLDLDANHISTIIWATGYRFDFSWIQLGTFDQYGYPITQQGISRIPGLYFVGIHGMYKNKSGLIYGVSEIALKVAEQISTTYCKTNPYAYTQN